LAETYGRQGSSSEYINIQKKLANQEIYRRLTPKECFRLMGFLEDEINLEGLSDTACYKLAGNGWDINVVSLIFKQLFKNEALQ
jgi:site-specific DNA-cytosine methylase